MRKKKLLGISLGIITIIIVISLGFVGNYFYNLALNPDTPKDIVFGTPEEAEARVKEVDLAMEAARGGGLIQKDTFSDFPDKGNKGFVCC